MTLKHIILSLSVMAAGTVAVHAQRVNFTIGGGISSHTGSSTDNVGAFKIGASYEYEIPGNFSIEPGVFFYAKGYKDKNESVYMRDDKDNIVNDEDGNPLMGVKNVSTGKFYVEVPVMANYYLEVSPLHYIEFSAGPYAAVGVGGSAKRAATPTRIYKTVFTTKSPLLRKKARGVSIAAFRRAWHTNSTAFLLLECKQTSVS